MPPGSPFNHPQRFEQAIREGKVGLAWASAREIGELGLARALSLTLLLARERDQRYERTASRFLIRLIEERRPTLRQLAKVADALDSLWRVRGPPALRVAAENALEDLRRQLEQR